MNLPGFLFFQYTGGKTQEKSTRPVFTHICFLSFFMLLSFPARSGALDIISLLDEYRTLSYKLAYHEKALVDAGSSSISPGIDSIRSEFVKSQTILKGKLEEISRLVTDEFAENKTSRLELFTAYLSSIPACDPARSHFNELGREILSSINSILISPANESLNHELERKKQALELALDISSELSSMETMETSLTGNSGQEESRNRIPIYIAFLWHMHQPVYWPYEDIVTTEKRRVYSYSLFDIMHARTGPYTSWPFNAIQSGLDLPHLGAQVSFSGSLIENLNALERAGIGFSNWKQYYIMARAQKTALGNPRLDLVAFGYHHPLMALIDYKDIRKQIQAHRKIIAETFGADVPYSKGIFPPENAFAEWMIPALVDEGLEWVLVDNIHFDRAAKNYPWTKASNLFPPNPADQVNPDPGEWVQLYGLWAPSKVSPWGYRPHYAVLRDRETGAIAKTPEGKEARIIVVPAAHYEGNEDGRGGFGALNYEMVMSQLEKYNTDPKHPLLIVLHHDGDNYGGGSEGYYHGNFTAFVNWARANSSRFVPTTVQDYLAMFPPDPSDIIHVEPGSWAGADNGDPEFSKWNGDPDPQTGYSPDRNSWAIITAASNFVHTADSLAPDSPDTLTAWRYLMVSQTSCYEYWDGTEMWDSHPARACNQAVTAAKKVLGDKFDDRIPPSIYAPQREPYNPGGYEWLASPMPTDFTVWTFVYDVSDLESVTLKYRKAGDSTWSEQTMTGRYIPSRTDPLPLVKAKEYSAKICGEKNTVYEYFVEAKDRKGNTGASHVMKVFVGAATATGGQGTPAASWSPEKPRPQDIITIYADRPCFLHWGVNGWTMPAKEYWPENSVPWPDGKAIETKLDQPVESGNQKGKYCVRIGPFTGSQKVEKIDLVLHYLDNTWARDQVIELSWKKK